MTAFGDHIARVAASKAVVAIIGMKFTTHVDSPPARGLCLFNNSDNGSAPKPAYTTCGSFAVGTPGLNGRYLDGTTEPGVVRWTNAASGNSKRLLSVQVGSSGFWTYTRHSLVDLIWINSGIVVSTTGLQSFTPTTLVGRDENGLSLGHGLRAALLVTGQVPTGALVTTLAYDYTNENGVARTNVAAGLPLVRDYGPGMQGRMVPFNLYPGDKGVRSIDGIRLGTTLVSGSVSMILYRPVVTLGVGIYTYSTGREPDWIDLADVRLYDGTALVPMAVAGNPSDTAMAIQSFTVRTVEVGA